MGQGQKDMLGASYFPLTMTEKGVWSLSGQRRETLKTTRNN